MILTPGKSLCPTCNNKLFLSTEDDDSLEGPSFIPPETIDHVVDHACSVLGVSPVSKIRKLSTEKRGIAIEKKISKISQTLKRKLCKFE